ncbi:MAG: hypothetical protein IPQ07_15295 [Myxococcales bacterium]|nr:hypothetical protein [Myxococcales bacterium]
MSTGGGPQQAFRPGHAEVAADSRVVVTEAAHPIYLIPRAWWAGTLLLAATVTFSLFEKHQWEQQMDPRQQDLIKNRVRYIGGFGGVLSLATIATGIVLYVTAPDREKVSDGTAPPRQLWVRSRAGSECQSHSSVCDCLTS